MKNSKKIADIWWAVAAIFGLCALMSCGSYRPNYASATASAISGASWGVREKLRSDNAAFFRVFPKADKEFWGPDSWLNKYNGRNPENGRNRKPIWITDGWHLLGTTSQVTAFSSGAFIATKKRDKRWHYLLDFGICFASYSASNYFIHDILLKK